MTGAKSTDCGSIAPGEVWIVVDALGDTYLMESEAKAREAADLWDQPEHLWTEGPHTVHRYALGTESGSVPAGYVSVGELRRLAHGIEAEADGENQYGYDSYIPGKVDGLRMAAGKIEDLADSAQPMECRSVSLDVLRDHLDHYAFAADHSIGANAERHDAVASFLKDLIRETVQATEQESVFSADDLRRVLEWHEEVRTTCGISVADDNLRKRIVGALREMEEKSVPREDGDA
jgi:hypothetical protein